MSTGNRIAILDFGSQYTQLIARRVRELQVYCEIFPWNVPPESLQLFNPGGFILSGGPSSVYADGAPSLQPFIIESGLPLLGICYGMQLLAHELGGKVLPSQHKEYGLAQLECRVENPLLPVGDQVVQPPARVSRSDWEQDRSSLRRRCRSRSNRDRSSALPCS